MDYKEQWTEYYEDSRELGFSEDEAEEQANASLCESYASQIDAARDRAKEVRYE